MLQWRQRLLWRLRRWSESACWTAARLPTATQVLPCCACGAEKVAKMLLFGNSLQLVYCVIEFCSSQVCLPVRLSVHIVRHIIP